MVMTGWEDRMDGSWKGKESGYSLHRRFWKTRREGDYPGKELRVEIEKNPFRICVYDAENTLLHADIVDLAYMEDSNHRRIHTSEITPQDCFYGFGERAENLTRHRSL